MRIKVLVFYSVFLRALLRMHFCACFFTLFLLLFGYAYLSPSVEFRIFKNVVANALLRMVFYITLLRMHFCAWFFTCTFVHVHLSDECFCARFLTRIRVLEL
ncbi:hypothetical protein MIMGU_mgv11b020585mg [Erythranthe guttata]|uniref:Uncharacterized protein n=1 Tax=Erythranthe guttata TaxID=4155 RepID=A0A022R2J9_ERYGU|nr:hypothetical protein MIMGU_mgv11b020585mg [Erythranthe guttata]